MTVMVVCEGMFKSWYHCVALGYMQLLSIWQETFFGRFSDFRGCKEILGLSCARNFFDTFICEAEEITAPPTPFRRLIAEEIKTC